MPNPNPSKARASKRRKRRVKAGNIQDITNVLWSAITKLEQHLASVYEKEVDTAELCKLTHALSQSASTYLKALEVGEYEARLEELERVYEVRKAS